MNKMDRSERTYKTEKTYKTDKTDRCWRQTLSLSPLCICALATAIILQQAQCARSAAVVDDALPGSLWSYIHPATEVFLCIGYIIAILIPAVTVRNR